MPVITCKTCGHTTNTACSNAWSDECNHGAFATECYAAWDDKNKIWVKGCAYDKADPYMKYAVDSLLRNEPVIEEDLTEEDEDES